MLPCRIRRSFSPMAFFLTCVPLFYGCGKAATSAAPEESATMFVTRDTTEVQTPSGAVVGHLKYAEPVRVGSCLNGWCPARWKNGEPVKVRWHDLVSFPPPSGEKYADEGIQLKSINGKTEKIKLNEKVRISSYNAESGEVVLAGYEGSVKPDLLRDEPIPAEEIKSRRELERVVAKQEAEDRREAARTALQERRNFADTLRTRYLDNYLDIKVRVSGSKADRITLEYVLFNDVWARKLQTEGALDTLREKGFKRIDMTNGYDYHVYWTY